MELNQKLAEWAGFKMLTEPLWERTETHRRGTRVRYVYPDGRRMALLPPFTTSPNNCFKYLVPQSLEILAKEGYIPPIMKLFQLWYDELVSLTGDSSNVRQVALALCLAISKLIEGENEAKG